MRLMVKRCVEYRAAYLLAGSLAVIGPDAASCTRCPNYTAGPTVDLVRWYAHVLPIKPHVSQQAASFDGTSTSINLQDASRFGFTGSFSFMAWVKPTFVCGDLCHLSPAADLALRWSFHSSQFQATPMFAFLCSFGSS